jgi:hypothetical protein
LQVEVSDVLEGISHHLSPGAAEVAGSNVAGTRLPRLELV